METKGAPPRMNRFAALAALLILVAGAAGTRIAAQQSDAGPDYSSAQICARCHLHNMLEWSVSRHSEAGTTCTACHGPSEGHVVDERNNVKPDRIPRGEEIASLCLDCHSSGCAQTGRKDACQSCHHVHALVDVRKRSGAAATQAAGEEQRRAYQAAMSAGAELVTAERWQEALEQFEQARRIRPKDPAAGNRVAFCRRRLDPELAGFRIIGRSFDPETGLARRAEVAELGMEMALIPGGEADIGDPALPSSRLVHTVRIEPFYLARTEVTQQQWLTIMGSNPSSYRAQSPEQLQLPVETVSWADCQQFLAKLNARISGGGFRLPTEAEWEYAFRKGALGGGSIEQVAWFRDNTRDGEAGRKEPPEFSAPRPVGSKRPNALGLDDMQGNVWEWCSTLFRPYPYHRNDGREDPAAEGPRVLRGGSFVDRADLLNPAFRHSERPQRRFRWNGLRVARSVPR